MKDSNGIWFQCKTNRLVKLWFVEGASHLWMLNGSWEHSTYKGTVEHKDTLTKCLEDGSYQRVGPAEVTQW